MAEVERKFAVEHLPDDGHGRPVARICQGYLAFEPAEERIMELGTIFHRRTS